MDLSKTSWKDWINPLKWWSVIQSIFLQWFLSQAKIEQYMIRFIRCYDCVKLGYCKNCGCDTEAKMLVPNELDSTDPDDPSDHPRWGPFLSDKEWEEMKKNNNIKFSVKINNNEYRQE